jgi:hypothetical protein
MSHNENFDGLLNLIVKKSDFITIVIKCIFPICKL